VHQRIPQPIVRDDRAVVLARVDAVLAEPFGETVLTLQQVADLIALLRCVLDESSTQ
jgi:hypothetical protein